jgi:CRISPR-associated protein Cmr4
MNSSIVGMLAETSVHPGSGQSTGFVDLPVAREEATDYPVIVGSSLKGAFRERARERGWDDGNRAERVFGEPDRAGQVLVSDARLMLLPVRSLNDSYKWVTCPHLVERLVRDLRRAGRLGRGFDPSTFEALKGADEFSALAPDDGSLFLEERQFDRVDDVPGVVHDLVEPLVAHPETRNRLEDRLVVLKDRDFAWFARFGLSVDARNVLDDETKESKNLWYEETLPADSLFYAVLAPRSGNGDGVLDELDDLFADENAYLQVGGNETIGQGWMALEWYQEANRE